MVSWRDGVEFRGEGAMDADEQATTLLYVEDEADIRELIGGMLTRNYPGLQLLVAGDGHAGLELFRERQPEIVMTDICMPVMDGLQMASALRSLNPEIFLIAVTAASDADKVMRALEIGFNQYVLKPVDQQKLFAAVDTCRALHAMRRQITAQEGRIRQLSRVVAESPSSVVVTDVRGIITYVNPRFTRMTGYTGDEVLGRHPRFLKSDVMPPEVYDQLRTTVVSGREWRGELLNRHKSGVLYWESMSIFPLRGDDGEIVNYVAVSEDVTERKQAESAITALNRDLAVRAADLEAANRELEAFSYTVAHDLHGPLQWIGGYSRAILKRSGDRLDETCRRYLEEIATGVVRMEQVIEALLDFSRFSRDTLQRQTVDLGEIARAVAADLQKIEPGRAVTFRIAEGVTVSGDRHLLFVVLQNLLGNAWKYTGKQADAVIEFGVQQKRGGSACFVRDNGSGFDPRAAGKIFEPFYRLSEGEEFRGLGIGLATVQRIIQRHGGTVWAEAAPGAGATFYFTIG